MTKKHRLTDEERQAFIDSLPSDQVNRSAKETFDNAISRASQQKQLKLETPDTVDGYSDKQTHSHTTEDTSG